jgi:hypothetical protein
MGSIGNIYEAVDYDIYDIPETGSNFFSSSQVKSSDSSRLDRRESTTCASVLSTSLKNSLQRRFLTYPGS